MDFPPTPADTDLRLVETWSGSLSILFYKRSNADSQEGFKKKASLMPVEFDSGLATLTVIFAGTDYGTHR